MDIQMRSFHGKDLTSVNSQDFGSFPTCSPAAYDYVSDSEGANTNMCALSGPMESDMGRHKTSMPGEWSYGDFRSMPASLSVEKTYGHLPA
jgi:hypothetical protein